MKDLRYDRQVRLWGDDGQSAIETTTVCLLGANALGTEILKCLVLAGIESFCIIDDAIVEQPDLGTNFFLEEGDAGRGRAVAAVELLKELNPRVKASSIVRSPISHEQAHLDELRSFSVVVATNMSESEARPISAHLFDRQIPFIHVRTYGFLGYLRICVREHTIVNTHKENVAPDLRLDRPFPALAELFASIDMEKLSDEQVHHTPYLLLYAAALSEWRKSIGDSTVFPDTFAKRKALLPYVIRFQRESESGGAGENFEQAKTSIARSMMPTQIPSRVQSVLADEKCDERNRGQGEPFWIMCTALRRFVERHGGVLPLPGQLPDMASDSASYTRLVTIYHDKAVQDAKEVLEDVRSIEEDNKRKEDEDINMNDEDSLPTAVSPSTSAPISREACARFCKNAAVLDVHRGSDMSIQRGANTFKSVISSICSHSPEDPTSSAVPPALWLLLLKAADRFKDEKSRYPGTNGIPCEIDAGDVRKRVEAIVRETLTKIEGDDDEDEVTVEAVLASVSRRSIDEMCRFGASEVHVVAALIGGIAAQEVIKLATRQYLPVENTLVFDAHSSTTEVFKL